MQQVTLPPGLRAQPPAAPTLAARDLCDFLAPTPIYIFGVCAPHRICQESSRNCWIRLLRTVHSRTCVFAYTCCSIRDHFARPGQELLGPSLGKSVFFTFVEIQISVFLQESESIGSLEHVSNEHLENRLFFKIWSFLKPRQQLSL